MLLGLFTPLFGSLSFDGMLVEVRRLGLNAIELGTGGYPGSHHLDVDGLLADGNRVGALRSRLADERLLVSALSCHGNPLHPDRDLANEHDQIFRKTVRLAQQMGVSVVNTFSGCPGDSDGATAPNWVTCAWPTDFQSVLAWQWEEKAIPYWREAARFAADHGVSVAIEMHPGFLVYNVETALRLREAAGRSLGVNFDPSHLFWAGADIPAAIHALGDGIFHVHAKDVAVNARHVAVNGIIDAKDYRDSASRAWIFRSVGWGHGEPEWTRIVSALRSIGYDYVLSIEHEDPLASVEDGLRNAVDLLTRIIKG